MTRCLCCGQHLPGTPAEKDALIDLLPHLGDKKLEVLKLLVQSDKVPRERFLTSLWLYDEEPENARDSLYGHLFWLRRELKPLGWEIICLNPRRVGGGDYRLRRTKAVDTTAEL